METKLEFTFKNDTLFKMLFTQYPDLLKRLVAELLSIQYESIGKFEIKNPELPGEFQGDKFCRLDIKMTVDEQQVDLEIQIKNERDYPERSLYYWARDYSSALNEGEDYINLPRTVSISILGFNLFDCDEFHSEFQALEVTRHTPLTDRLSLHYFELPKLPEVDSAEDKLKLWLALFKAETKEDLAKIEEMGEPIMEQAIEAYNHITTSEKLREIERMRSDARHNEAAFKRHLMTLAREEGMAEGIKVSDQKWQSVVSELQAEITRLRAQLEK